MEMITKKLIERSGQGSFNTTDTGNDKKGKLSNCENEH